MRQTTFGPYIAETEQERQFSRRLRLLDSKEGVSKLVEWLITTDYFVAPASSKYHGAYRGGLLEHSLAVAEYMEQSMYLDRNLKNIEYTPEDLASAIFVALFHDVCKVDRYMLQDDGSYKIKDDYPYGHGEYSVYLINKHMQLTDEEAIAIRYHMGPWENTDKRVLSDVYNKYPLAWRLHLADMWASKTNEMPSDSHENWLKQKMAEGWVYGPIKDPEKKEHPCCVPYEELPPEQKIKDTIFIDIVHAAAIALCGGIIVRGQHEIDLQKGLFGGGNG